jgi:hypothetical protein
VHSRWNICGRLLLLPGRLVRFGGGEEIRREY